MQWCILRTAPSRTLLLAAALEGAGFRAWTPRETRKIRLPRSRASREVSSPLTPTIVFADYDQLPRLVSMSRMPSPSCSTWSEQERRQVSVSIPNFTVFKHLDTYPRVADRALDALRVAEETVKPRAARHVFQRNDEVKVYGAGFDGLVGKVERTRGRFTFVEFPGSKHLAMFDSRLLLPFERAA
jgi:hypothetical protein